jgi:sec-independent protein translocase protein TatA
MFGSLSTPELIIILVIVLLIFGAGRLPEVFRSLGSGIKEFREASSGDSKDAKKKSDDAASRATADPS